jgi:excisionase family DNA binding protein
MQRNERAPGSNDGRRWFTVEEAGAQFGLGRSASYRAVRRGELPAIRFGRKLVVPAATVEKMLRGE